MEQATGPGRSQAAQASTIARAAIYTSWKRWRIAVTAG
jgi:hypothetical protein